MSIFSYLLPKKEKSASVAKERLQIIVARERATRGGRLEFEQRCALTCATE